ncbi:GNAT family N-acetyltransferase [Tenacibaculum sp. UWU-22]|uniref:GNAT family N-acetyltransferase n=1 Tax=Tenacibaculum sp. UWU-22 TaxID=3234187 RepID=UPI0034DACE32
MQVLHENTNKKGAFYVMVNQNKEAEMTYTWAGTDKIIIDHTEVSDVLRGQGVGYKLVEAAVHFMRDNNVKAIPLCPFAKSVFDKTPEYADVLFKK